MNKLEKQDLLQSIKELLVVSKQDVYRYVNTRMVYVYFEIGRQIEIGRASCRERV